MCAACRFLLMASQWTLFLIWAYKLQKRSNEFFWKDRLKLTDTQKSTLLHIYLWKLINMKVIIQTFNKTQEQSILINWLHLSQPVTDNVAIFFHTHNHIIFHDFKHALETCGFTNGLLIIYLRICHVEPVKEDVSLGSLKRKCLICFWNIYIPVRMNAHVNPLFSVLCCTWQQVLDRIIMKHCPPLV